MVGELVASSAALRFAGGWLFGVLLKQLAFLSLAALQARWMMVGKCVAGYAALDLRAVGPSVHCLGPSREIQSNGIHGGGKQKSNYAFKPTPVRSRCSSRPCGRRGLMRR